MFDVIAHQRISFLHEIFIGKVHGLNFQSPMPLLPIWCESDVYFCKTLNYSKKKKWNKTQDISKRWKIVGITKAREFCFW